MIRDPVGIASDRSTAGAAPAGAHSAQQRGAACRAGAPCSTARAFGLTAPATAASGANTKGICSFWLVMKSQQTAWC